MEFSALYKRFGHGSTWPSTNPPFGLWLTGIAIPLERWYLDPPATGTIVGAVFGGGLARRAGPVTITPSFRYTRWGIRSDGANRNQAEFLVGLSF